MNNTISTDLEEINNILELVSEKLDEHRLSLSIINDHYDNILHSLRNMEHEQQVNEMKNRVIDLKRGMIQRMRNKKRNRDKLDKLTNMKDIFMERLHHVEEISNEENASHSLSNEAENMLIWMHDKSKIYTEQSKMMKINDEHDEYPLPILRNSFDIDKDLLKLYEQDLKLNLKAKIGELLLIDLLRHSRDISSKWISRGYKSNDDISDREGVLVLLRFAINILAEDGDVATGIFPVDQIHVHNNKEEKSEYNLNSPLSKDFGAISP